MFGHLSTNSLWRIQYKQNLMFLLLLKLFPQSWCSVTPSHGEQLLHKILLRGIDGHSMNILEISMIKRVSIHIFMLNVKSTSFFISVVRYENVIK